MADCGTVNNLKTPLQKEGVSVVDLERSACVNITIFSTIIDALNFI
jgi:hypothetical protein